MDREIYDDYLNGRITKTICEAKNLNKLLQAREPQTVLQPAVMSEL